MFLRKRRKPSYIPETMLTIISGSNFVSGNTQLALIGLFIAISSSIMRSYLLDESRSSTYHED